MDSIMQIATQSRSQNSDLVMITQLKTEMLKIPKDQIMNYSSNSHQVKYSKFKKPPEKIKLSRQGTAQNNNSNNTEKNTEQLRLIEKYSDKIATQFFKIIKQVSAKDNLDLSQIFEVFDVSKAGQIS